MRSALLLLLFTSWAQGQVWRGEPGELTAVKEAADRGEAAAMAEYGWFMYRGLAGPFDVNELERLFSIAAEKGNLLGKLGLARLHLNGYALRPDLDLAERLVLEAVELDHPAGKALVPFLARNGRKVAALERGDLDSQQCLEEAAEGGSVAARYSLARSRVKEADTREAVLEYFDFLEAEAPTYPWLAVMGVSDTQTYRNHLSAVEEERFTERFKRLRQPALERGYPEALYRRFSELRDEGKIEEGWPYIARAVSQRHAHSMGILPWAVRFQKEYRGRLAHADANRLLQEAWKRGARFQRLGELAAEAFFGRSKEDPEIWKLVEEALTDTIERKNNYAHHAWGKYLFIRLRNGLPIRGDARRALGHALIYCHIGPYGGDEVGELYARGWKGVPMNLPRAHAAFEWMTTVTQKQKMQVRLKQVKNRMTEEQLQESKRLREEGFPSAEEFRREGEALLRESGDPYVALDDPEKLRK
ncbi:MAG: hypothetical protein AAF555_08870 [Verrucomicrobiota bacterium]